MRPILLDRLACPVCRGALTLGGAVRAGDDILSGSLACPACPASWPIEDGVPRFVERDNYGASFGLQWNQFRAEQIDAINGADLSAKRFFSETGWSPEQLKGRWILDAGCGAGRFLDVASQAGAEVVGVDISSAVDAARANMEGRPNVDVVQASLFDLPFRPGAFDLVYCIGVIQHTPDPARAMSALPVVLRPGGEIAVTMYERKPWTKLQGKYLVRPLTRRMSKPQLLGAVKGAMRVLFPVTDIAYRAPVVGRLFEFLMPVANYVHERSLTRRQRYDWAVLDTFDMLSPEYDQPQTQAEAERALGAGGAIHLQRRPNPGLNLVGRKREDEIQCAA